MSILLFSLILALWLVFTGCFAHQVAYRGFSRMERDEFLEQYATRVLHSRAALLANPPAVIRRLCAFRQPFLEGALIFALNTAIPLLSFLFLEIAQVYWLILSLAAVELVGTILAKHRIWTPYYRADFERYLSLTMPLDNECVEGRLVGTNPETDPVEVERPRPAPKRGFRTMSTSNAGRSTDPGRVPFFSRIRA